MLIPKIQVFIQQNPTLLEKLALKNLETKIYQISFVNNWEYTRDWSDLTNSGSIRLPRNIYVKDSKTNQEYPLFKKSKYIITAGGKWDPYSVSPEELQQESTQSNDITKYDSESDNSNSDLVTIPLSELKNRPVFRRGDTIIIIHNYKYWLDEYNEEIGGIVPTPKQTPPKTVFGYITNVSGDFDIELNFSDSMYLLKQYSMANINYISKKNDKNPIATIIQQLLDGVNSTYKIKDDKYKLKLNMLGTTISYDKYLLYLSYETAAQFLDRLKKDFHLEIFFKDNVLNVGYLITYDEDKNNLGNTEYYNNLNKPIFHFQDNIISSNLSYKSKKDVILSCVSEGAIIEDSTTNFDKKGNPKKNKKKLVVYTTYDLKGELFSWSIDKDKPINKNYGGNLHEIPSQISGEKRTFFFPQANTIKELITLTEEKLSKFHYDGFSGSFTTFGTPYVDYDTIIELKNDRQEGQNGFYRVKSVKYSGGVDGYRQEIEVYYKFNIDDTTKKIKQYE